MLCAWSRTLGKQKQKSSKTAYGNVFRRENNLTPTKTRCRKTGYSSVSGNMAQHMTTMLPACIKCKTQCQSITYTHKQQMYKKKQRISVVLTTMLEECLPLISVQVGQCMLLGRIGKRRLQQFLNLHCYPTQTAWNIAL